MGIDCDEDRLQDKCCSLEIFLDVFCQFVMDCVTCVNFGSA